MASKKQNSPARKNFKKAAAVAKRKRTIAHLPKATRPHSVNKPQRSTNAAMTEFKAHRRALMVQERAPSACGSFRTVMQVGALKREETGSLTLLDHQIGTIAPIGRGARTTQCVQIIGFK